jgi:hypothetical protein
MADAGGSWTDKQDELMWIKENSHKPDSFRDEIKRLDIYDNGAAMIAGTGHIINDQAETV